MIKVGESYSFRGECLLVVVSHGPAEHPQGEKFVPGFTALILVGSHKGAPWLEPKGPGETFTCAESSAMANDSVRFPTEG